MGIPPSDYLKMEARLNKPGAAASNETGSGGLHEQIEDELKLRRWYYVHSRTDRKTTTQLGVPDFIIAAPEKFDHVHTYWIEAKRKGGKLTKEQNIARHCLQALGHNWACVHSFEEFLAVIGD